MRVRRPSLRACLKGGLLALLLASVLLLAPVAYVEVACRGDAEPRAYRPLITDPAWQRREANTYLTYPEWHIVFAYDGLAQALKDGDEHAFDYAPSIRAFWTSTCALMQVADAHGGADGATRGMIHTIGVSFTAEMAIKGLYEETVGRATAWIRGPRKTPQDLAVAAMAADYAAFLRQTPWYAYPFRRAAGQLWNAPVDGVIRGWERRFGIGVEFLAKSAYAVLIGHAAASAPAELTIRSVVSGLDAAVLARMPHVTVIGPRGGGTEIETPRYALFTTILAEIARRGGTILEIAGNDEVMVTLTRLAGTTVPMPFGAVILRVPREGFPSERLLVDVPLPELASLLNAYPLGDPGVEHVFDY